MQTVEMAREKLFTMRFSTDEFARLDRVAKSYGLNGAAVIRMLLKREDDASQANAPAAPKPKAKAKRP